MPVMFPGGGRTTCFLVCTLVVQFAVLFVILRLSALRRELSFVFMPNGSIVLSLWIQLNSIWSLSAKAYGVFGCACMKSRT